jgi:hypothetical protein
MIKSKVMGEKLANNSMRSIYGGGCGSDCAPGCNCTPSNGALFQSPADRHMDDWDGNFQKQN